MLLGILYPSAILAQDREIVHQFPKDYYGQWEGALQIFKGEEVVRTLPMMLDIHPVSEGRDAWKIVYYVDRDSVVKDYELITDDSIPGHYLIDEKNTILLDGYVHGGVFIQQFEVSGSLLTVRVQRRGSFLEFEISAGPSMPIRKSGDTTFLEEKIPPVESFELNVRQFAVLNKK